MPRILILFGTTDGQTAKIARTLGEELRTLGAEVDVVRAGADVSASRPEDYAGIIVAASVHVRRFQQPVRRWLRAHAAGLRGKPTAFLSVCLAVLQKDDEQVQRDIQTIINGLLTATGWQPTIVRKIPGALLYTRYNWLVRMVMRQIARTQGRDTDVTRDYEYTNWDDLRAFAREFHALVERPA